MKNRLMMEKATFWVLLVDHWFGVKFRDWFQMQPQSQQTILPAFIPYQQMQLYR